MSLRSIVRSPFAAYLSVGALLAGAWVLAFTSILNKSLTCDEPLYLTGGYSYWTRNDYRMDFEQGNLLQRWMALPLVIQGGYRLPAEGKGIVDTSQVTWDFFYGVGNDAKAMMLRGRGMMAALGVVLGYLVYRWSSGLFGRGGGMISLLLYTFSTAMLANMPLMTSDLAASLCFLGSAWCLWVMLHRVSVATVLGSSLAMSALFMSKMSAGLIVPIGVILIAARLIHNRPLTVALGRTRSVASRKGQLAIFLVALVVHAAVVWGMIWALYGFRYAAMDGTPAEQARMSQAYWDKLLPGRFPLRSTIEFLDRHRLLPEAFLMGHAHVLKYSQFRPAFLNGQWSVHGWWAFFPYCFLVKTPLPVFLILLLAAAAAVRRWKTAKPKHASEAWRSICGGLYATWPLWTLMAVYWTFAITSKMNIGHRHILPVYPPMFILAGAAARWFQSRWLTAKVVLALSLAAVVAESLATWPNYLAYFNQLAGGPKHGYRHLVDSSLDWGQDVPGLKDWLDRHGLLNQDKVPVYLSYFGRGNPTYYGINVERLAGFLDKDASARTMILRGGVYCVSATLLESVLLWPLGPWSKAYEGMYQSLLAGAGHLLIDDPQGQTITSRQDLRQAMLLFSELQSGRLCAFLRKREPDDNVGYSILIYRLTDEEVKAAMFGPPAELADEIIPLRHKLAKE